jgi:uncharacterized protein
MKNVTLPAVPQPLGWHNQPVAWSTDPDGSLEISAGAQTDWFVDPSGRIAAQNAAALLFEPDPVCILNAFVTVEYRSRFDAGVLVIYQNPASWAKLCLELSPLNQLMIVSVVTRGKSDDCNSYLVQGKSSFLRISRLEKAFAFHASLDGENWNLIRHFTLNGGSVQMGFMAQAPTGAGCTVRFSQIHYAVKLLEDIRSGK